MKINIIFSKSKNNSIIDANILCFLFKKIKHKIEPKYVELENYKCDNASINIFIGTINPLFIQNAKTNILLFDSSIFPKSHNEYLKLVDYIFTKTEYETNLVSISVTKKKIKYIGWRSSDLNFSSSTPDYSKYLLFCYDDSSDYSKIINTWQNTEFTNHTRDSDIKLHVVNFNLTKMKEKDITSDNIVIEKNLTQENFEQLFNECGVHLCLPSLNSFSHYLNQTVLSRCIPLVTDISSNYELVSPDHSYKVTGKIIKNKYKLGSSLEIDSDSLKQSLINSTKLSEQSLEELGVESRKNAIKNHNKNDILFKESLTNIIKETLDKPKSKNKYNINDLKDDDLPTVSIVTLTHNRKKFFNLAILNFNSIDYPKEKLEWIIYDTSNEENCVEKLLPPENSRHKYNIKYVKNDTIESIGTSRNIAFSKCSNEIILLFDDDDYYPSTSVKQRIIPFIKNDTISIVACSIIGSFELNKYISYIDAPSIFGHPNKKYKIATLALRKSSINKDICDDSSIDEFYTFLSSNLNKIFEISWEGVIISLVHSKNTTFRKVPNTESNGSHFGFSEKMFKFITELDTTDEQLKEKEEAKKRAIEEMLKQKNMRTAPENSDNTENAENA